MVVGLFCLLAYVGFRIASRSVDPFLRLLTSTITVLIVAQAFINIGYVIGVLPVTGIQLPLVSAGGTSALTVLAMLGLMANAARHEPEAVAALSVVAGRGLRAGCVRPHRYRTGPREFRLNAGGPHVGRIGAVSRDSPVGARQPARGHPAVVACRQGRFAEIG